jgi:hypothetical protein
VEAIVEFRNSRIQLGKEAKPRVGLVLWLLLTLFGTMVLSHANEAETASLNPNSPSSYDGILEDTLLPNNPHAIDHCLAKIRVTSARLRQSPSLSSPIIGSRQIDQPVYVEEVMGKWARVQLDEGGSAYIATYLLAFSWQDLLDQWKKGSPKPTVGKKAKVKWAKASLRAYPSDQSGQLGELRRNDLVGILGDSHAGWTFVQVNGAFGFLATQSLKSLHHLPRAFEAAPLAKLQKQNVNAVLPALESPSEYLARSAWSPELFQSTWPERKQQAIAQAQKEWEALDTWMGRPGSDESQFAMR